MLNAQEFYTAFQTFRSGMEMLYLMIKDNKNQ